MMNFYLYMMMLLDMTALLLALEINCVKPEECGTSFDNFNNALQV